jgi:hypothetical protein
MTHDYEHRMMAHRVVFTLWPDMPTYPKEHMTPEVATYLFVLFARAQQANDLIQALGKTLMPAPPTSWSAIPVMLTKAVWTGLNAKFETRGWALRSMLEYHRHLVKETLQYGPQTFPLAVRDAFTH